MHLFNSKKMVVKKLASRCKPQPKIMLQEMNKKLQTFKHQQKIYFQQLNVPSNFLETRLHGNVPMVIETCNLFSRVQYDGIGQKFLRPCCSNRVQPLLRTRVAWFTRSPPKHVIKSRNNEK